MLSAKLERVSRAPFNSVVQWGKDIINKLMEGLKAAWESVVAWFNGVWNSLFGNRTANVTVNKKVTGVDGSNAAGLDYVPFDGYISELHKGEMVVPANIADGLRNLGVTALSRGMGKLNEIVHSGTIRVEGVNNSGELMGVYDLLMNDLLQGARV